jgi:hypothetical protein
MQIFHNGRTRKKKINFSSNSKKSAVCSVFLKKKPFPKRESSPNVGGFQKFLHFLKYPQKGMLLENIACMVSMMTLRATYAEILGSIGCIVRKII